MKHLIKIFILSFLFYSFTNLEIREEIIQRYDNGNKKLLVKYQGQGTQEQVIERITYSEKGDTLLLEKPFENITIEKEYFDNGNLKSHLHTVSNNKKVFVYHENGQLGVKLHVAHIHREHTNGGMIGKG